MIRFDDLYERLLAVHGPQGWWPADCAFEIMVGALLVQRTTWQSASAAIKALQRADLIDPERLAKASALTLEPHIRGAGFYRMKAGRLRKMAAFVLASGGIDDLRSQSTTSLREALLGLEGVGPETADAILLYAFERPVVVVDGYLRRLARRLLASATAPADSDLRRWVTLRIDDVSRLNEFHALVVAHGRSDCASQPRCAGCRVRELCRTGAEAL